jgi:hypothetical protein
MGCVNYAFSQEKGREQLLRIIYRIVKTWS